MCMFKSLVFTVAVSFIVFQSVLSEKNPLCNGQNCDKFFENYLNEYNINVSNNTIKAQYKKQFLANLREIRNFNAKEVNAFKKGINKFSHLSYNGVVSQSLGLDSISTPILGIITSKPAASKCSIDSFDWRNEGAITAVKDQGSCGSCFAFAAIGAIESQISINYNKNISLSEQYAMECIYNFWKIGGDACNGGQPSYVYYLSYINRGFPTEKSVPYHAYDDGICPLNVSFVKEAGITSYRTFTGYRDNEIACLLAANGPLSVAIFVNSSLIQYSGGIYDDEESCGPNPTPNHAVLLIGFGVDSNNNISYFTLKNSWGTSWGEQGFFRMKKGINLCNINSLPQQPYM
ncbi:unnamed protein product [Chironomus riparius]|uniref:Uncharacterized protein n=1 Tax=Chironomus riparius TaxID=315576 RepID=A0A9N9RLF3_9DIPT|nr:unnamed protein product [Chironomus riparius]